MTTGIDDITIPVLRRTWSIDWPRDGEMVLDFATRKLPPGTRFEIRVGARRDWADDSIIEMLGIVRRASFDLDRTWQPFFAATRRDFIESNGAVIAARGIT